jgi:hypothetical protein
MENKQNGRKERTSLMLKTGIWMVVVASLVLWLGPGNFFQAGQNAGKNIVDITKKKSPLEKEIVFVDGRNSVARVIIPNGETVILSAQGTVQLRFGIGYCVHIHENVPSYPGEAPGVQYIDAGIGEPVEVTVESLQRQECTPKNTKQTEEPPVPGDHLLK